MAGDLLTRKLNHVRATGATTVATGNPGCLLHMVNGARKQGLNVRLAHPVTMLAEAYRKEELKIELKTSLQSGVSDPRSTVAG